MTKKSQKHFAHKILQVAEEELETLGCLLLSPFLLSLRPRPPPPGRPEAGATVSDQRDSETDGAGRTTDPSHLLAKKKKQHSSP